MKIRHVLIENFKSIKRFEHSFVNELTGEVRPVTAIFGDNGSGKTSVLQAIALVLSLATRKTHTPAQFRWHGFLSNRIGSLGETYIRIELELDEDEFQAEHEFFSEAKEHSEFMELLQSVVDELVVPPLTNSTSVLEYKSGKVSFSGVGILCRALRRVTSKNPAYQNLLSTSVYRFGDVFWYDQYRNLGSGVLDDQEHDGHMVIDWQAGVSSLRESLIGWWFYHKHQPSEGDVIKRLEKSFSNVFPGARFIGTQLMNPVNTRPKTSDWYFLIERDNTIYDISEMSSGEQAVFSMLYDFVSNDISRSIILIDELELHLHPPEQQALYNSLRKIGPDCQFIITSHSTYLKDIIPRGARIRLEGGRACL